LIEIDHPHASDFAGAENVGAGNGPAERRLQPAPSSSGRTTVLLRLRPRMRRSRGEEKIPLERVGEIFLTKSYRPAAKIFSTAHGTSGGEAA